MPDRKLVYTEESGDAAGYQTEVLEETEIWGAGNAAARPAAGSSLGDLWFLEEAGVTTIQRWDGATWVSLRAVPSGVAGGDLQGTYPNPTINPAALPQPADFDGVQLRLTAAQPIPTAFSDVLFDVVDVENNAAVLEADPVNADRILVKETGLYLINYDLPITATLGATTVILSQVTVNDGAAIAGSGNGQQAPGVIFTPTQANPMSTTALVELTAGDFLTLQISRSATGGTYTLEAGATFKVVRLRGRRGIDGVDGQDGDPGPQGPPGSGTTLGIEQAGVIVPGSPFSTLDFASGIEVVPDGITVRASVILDEFSAYYDAAGQSFTAGPVTLLLDTERFASSANYTLAGNEVTVAQAARYDIQFEAVLRSSGGGRTRFETFLEVDRGLGFAEEPGTRSDGYLRQSPYGDTFSCSLKLDLPANAILRVRGVRGSGNGTAVTRAVRFNMERKS